MTRLWINPRYERLLRQAKLETAERVLQLSGTVIGGHPDRYVARVTIAAGDISQAAFLKREHRAIWKERIVNWCLGYGFVSKTIREAKLLARAQRAEIVCPDPIAWGIDDRGRSFVLLAALERTIELRRFLPHVRGDKRSAFLRSLGQALARIHAVGFTHPDLYAKHVLVSEHDQGIAFIDWQRSHQRPRVPVRLRCRDLAGLDATLADSLASARDRLRVMRAYLEASQLPKADSRKLVGAVQWQTKYLLTRKRYQRLRAESPSYSRPSIHWLDNDAICVTELFRRLAGAEGEAWLRRQLATPLTPCTKIDERHDLAGAGSVLLVRSSSRSMEALFDWLLRRALVTPELRKAGAALLRESQSESGPVLLAFGQRRKSPWASEGFILTAENYRCPLRERVSRSAACPASSTSAVDIDSHNELIGMPIGGPAC